MASDELSFESYIEQRKSGAFGRDDAARYAYSADIAMLKGFSRLRPVELAAAAVVRTGGEMLKGQLLGQAVKVGPKQFPRIYDIAKHCADTLHVPVPQLYIVNSPIPNAMTFGTDDDSVILVHSALIDNFSEKELQFVIGHETGHIQNKHVVYGTALQILTNGAGLLLAWIVQPALVALQAWYRRAEITCDRAGLLCCRDEHAAVGSFMKLAIGSTRLFNEMNVDAYLDQLEEGRKSVGRYGEVFVSHPYLPKRIRALRTFAESSLYRQTMGLEGGASMEEIDERTSRIISIDGGAPETTKTNEENSQ